MHEPVWIILKSLGNILLCHIECCTIGSAARDCIYNWTHDAIFNSFHFEGGGPWINMWPVFLINFCQPIHGIRRPINLWHKHTCVCVCVFCNSQDHLLSFFNSSRVKVIYSLVLIKYLIFGNDIVELLILSWLPLWIHDLRKGGIVRKNSKDMTIKPKT